MSISYGTGQLSQTPQQGTPSYTHSELHFATAGQTTLSLLGSYEPHNDEIAVYLNGLPLISAQDYEEINSKAIDFYGNLEDNDIVCILYQTPAPQQFISPTRYTATQCLLGNQQYTLTISFDEIKDFKFTSRYSPLYSSVKLIRSDLGEWLNGFSDDAINYAIYESSKLLVDMVTDIPDPVPNYMKHYVRYKTEIDLLLAGYLNEAKGGSVVNKRLGDLQIDREQVLPSLRGIMAELYRKLTPWESRVLGGGEIMAASSAVKAGSTTFPLATRRSF